MPELDGVRGLAILLVLYWHYVANEVPPHAHVLARLFARAGILTWSGVDLFFVLSGFLLGGILLEQVGSPGLLKTFYIRRFFRIFPLYFAFLAVFFLCMHAMTGVPGWLFGSPLPRWSYWTYVQNIVMSRHGEFGAGGLSVTWSLAIEEQFYLLLPWLILCLRGRVLVSLLGLLALSAPVLRAILLGHPHGTFAAYVLLPCRWDSLFLGVIGAYAVRQPGVSQWIARHMGWMYGIIAVLLAGAAVLGLRKMAPVDTGGWPCAIGFTWFALLYLTLLLIALHAPPQSWLRRCFRSQVMTGMGLIAYGIYLIHLTAVGLLHYWFAGQDRPLMDGPRTVALTFVALLVTIAIAMTSFVLFESPLLRLGHRRKYQTVRAPASEGQHDPVAAAP